MGPHLITLAHVSGRLSSLYDLVNAGLTRKFAIGEGTLGKDSSPFSGTEQSASCSASMARWRTYGAVIVAD